MKIPRQIAVTFFLLAGSVEAEAASSLTLQHGPSFPWPLSLLTRTQPAYDFEVTQFWHLDANTLLEISVTEHVEPFSFTSGLAGEICACTTSDTSPAVSTFTFGWPSLVPAAVPFGYQVNNSYGSTPFYFWAGIDNVGFTGGISTVRIGEMETAVINGFETLRRFAADFLVQFGETTFVEILDPETGMGTFADQFIAYPGIWYAGSLRYQSDIAAFAYLAPVPEASTYGMMLVGLGLVGAVARSRRLVEG